MVNKTQKKNRKSGSHKSRNYRARKYKGKIHRGGNSDKCMYIHLGYNGSALGNQLFVYAAGIIGKMKSGYKLCMIYSSGNPHVDADYRSLLIQGEAINGNADNNTISIHNDVHQYDLWDDSTINVDGIHNYYMVGSLYHNYKSIEPAIPIIREDFKKVFAEKYPGFKETIDSKSAFIHIRRGDFLKVVNPDHMTSVEYYKNGIKMLKDAGITTIYLLSDDLEWCKENLDGLGLTPYEEKDEVKTLYLMSLCKGGAVLSPSTYSAWGAILGPDENNDSTIVYPEKWLQDKIENRVNFPSRWISKPL
jgi:hypothetical protein